MTIDLVLSSEAEELPGPDLQIFLVADPLH